jgi:hypothetical protein
MPLIAKSLLRRGLGLGMGFMCLAGCVSHQQTPAPPVVAQASPPPQGVTWARKDGQRMSGNPTLYQQGNEDKSQCEQRASQSGTLDFTVFSACMDEKGYYRRDLAS